MEVCRENVASIIVIVVVVAVMGGIVVGIAMDEVVAVEFMRAFGIDEVVVVDEDFGSEVVVVVSVEAALELEANTRCSESSVISIATVDFVFVGRGL